MHIFGGQAYPIEIHGFADLLPWQVAKADDEAIELTLTPNGLTKFCYPFDFKLTMRYTLAGNTAHLALTVANTGGQAPAVQRRLPPLFCHQRAGKRAL